LLAKTGVRLSVRDDSADARLVGNRKSLISALTSLLENALQAVDASSQGRIELSARRDEATIYIAVRDNGRGMDKATGAPVRALFHHPQRRHRPGPGDRPRRRPRPRRQHRCQSSPGAGADIYFSLPCQKN
jgi:K+-sensing histidine kinase KdpD